MTRTQIVSAVLAGALMAGPVYAQAPGTQRDATLAADGSPWKTLVRSLEPAAMVKLRLTDGRSLKGTVVATTDDTVTLQVRTRMPVPPRTIPFEQITNVERTHVGMNPGVKVLIGAGAVAGGAVLLVAAMFAAAYD